MEKVSAIGGKLAKYGVNILDIKYTDGVPHTILYEFRWRPKPGVSLWTKSFITTEAFRDEDILDTVIQQVQIDRALAESGAQYGE